MVNMLYLDTLKFLRHDAIITFFFKFKAHCIEKKMRIISIKVAMWFYVYFKRFLCIENLDFDLTMKDCHDMILPHS